jgi:parallel beta-helix repeat protein
MKRAIQLAAFELVLLAVFLVDSCTLTNANFAPSTPFPPPPSIYIRNNGSIDPPTAPLQQTGNFYILTGDIINYPFYVECNNIVIDGAGHTFKSAHLWQGLILTGTSGVTIKNMKVTVPGDGYSGIFLQNAENTTLLSNDFIGNAAGVTLFASSNNYVGFNNFASSNVGIWLFEASNNNVIANNIMDNNVGDIKIGGIMNRPQPCCSNIIARNNITHSKKEAISIDSSASNNRIEGNNIENGSIGIYFHSSRSSNNTVACNRIIHCTECGIMLSSNSNTFTENTFYENNQGIYCTKVSNNLFYLNNFVSNFFQVVFFKSTNGLQSEPEINKWDNAQVSGGNFWSDYNGSDANKDGFGDEPYLIEVNNTDNFPLMSQFSNFSAVPEYPYPPQIPTPPLLHSESSSSPSPSPEVASPTVLPSSSIQSSNNQSIPSPTESPNRTSSVLQTPSLIHSATPGIPQGASESPEPTISSAQLETLLVALTIIAAAAIAAFALHKRGKR